jgi:hypothetical protein
MNYPTIQNRKSEQGFVALVSAVVVSALLIIIAASLGYTGFFTRFNILDGEYKEISRGLAESCAELARVEIANNINYDATGGRQYPVGENAEICTIFPGPSSGYYRSHAEYKRSHTNIVAGYARSGSNVTVTSWSEVP